MQVRYKKSNQLGFTTVLASNNAHQGLDPLRPFAGQQQQPSINYSDQILRSVLSVNDLDHRNQFHSQLVNPILNHPQIISNSAAAIDPCYLVRSGNDVVGGSQPLDLRWFHHTSQNLDCHSHGEVVSPCHVGGDVADAESTCAGTKRRCLDDSREKSIERKHKRMIKNRESAARSRARKQAYTKELEEQVSRLKETNKWLKMKVVETKESPVENKPENIQLRRRNSANF